MPARKYRTIVSITVVIALLIFGSLIFSRHAQVASQTPAPNSVPAQAANPAHPGPAAAFVYTPKAATMALAVARKYLDESAYMTAGRLSRKTRRCGFRASSRSR
jgi:hypothetical protein